MTIRWYTQQKNSVIFWNCYPSSLIIFTVWCTSAAGFCYKPFLIKIGRSGNDTQTTQKPVVVSNFRDAAIGSLMLNLCLIWAEQGSRSTSEQVVRAVSTKSWTTKIAQKPMDGSIRRFTFCDTHPPACSSEIKIRAEHRAWLVSSFSQVSFLFFFLVGITLMQNSLSGAEIWGKQKWFNFLIEKLIATESGFIVLQSQFQQPQCSLLLLFEMSKAAEVLCARPVILTSLLVRFFPSNACVSNVWGRKTCVFSPETCHQH